MEIPRLLNPSSIELSRLKSWRILIIISALLVFDWLSILVNAPFLRQALGLIVLLFLPGLLLTQLFKIRCENIWESLVLSLGLSIFFLMFVGVIINQVFIRFGIPAPLRDSNIIGLVLLSCGLMTILLFAIQNRGTPSLRQVLMIDADGRSLLAPAILPILAAIGALTLNSGGSSLISITVLISIVILVLILSYNYQSISWELLAFSLLMIGLAMLLSFSLRSMHISGWDINQEFYVFQLTKVRQEWNFESFKDPYNACLSITILPMILHTFLGIQDEYIFKVVYQLIFAFVPLIIFFIARKYVANILAFLASLFFIFQPWFIQPAPALARQEIGLLFFALFIWVTFHHRFSKRQILLLQMLFGAALITSHYSTAYIAIILLTFTFLATKGLRWMLSHFNRPIWKTSFISGYTLLYLYVLTFFWTSIQTQTSGNVAYVFMAMLQNMKSSISSDLRSEDIRMSLFKMEQRFTEEDLRQYAIMESVKYSSLPNLYPATRNGETVLNMATSFEFPGIIRSPFVKLVISDTLFIAKQLTKVLLIIGALSWIYYLTRSRRLKYEFVVLNLICLAILFVFIVLPTLSLYYNLFRIYLQILMISSISLIIGFNFLFARFKDSVRVGLVTGLIVIFFISTNGLTNYLVGGPANMNLYNFGEEYDKFYTHPEEVSAAQWLYFNRHPADRVYADETAALRLISFGNGILDTDTAILPSTITKDSYVYLDYANLRAGVTNANFNGKQLTYRYPIEFLEKNKNLIYDNGGSRIYR